MRVMLVWGECVVCERVVRRGQGVTVGEASDCTLVLPEAAGVGARHMLFAPAERGWRLQAGAMMAGTVRVAGREHPLAEASGLVLGRGADGYVTLGPVAVLFACDDEDVTLPPPPLWFRVAGWDRGGLAALGLAAAVQLGVLVAAHLLWEERPHLAELALRPRPTTWTPLPPPAPPSEAQVGPVPPGKRAGGDEGAFGRPDERRPSKVAHREGAPTDRVRETAVARALTTNLATGALAQVFGGQTSFTNRLNAAMAGEGDVLVLGAGAYGMGTRGLGSGGGGTGFGQVHGMGDLDVGGGRGAGPAGLGRRVPKAPRATSHLPRGDLSGFCREADIQKTVMARRNGPAYCYEKALGRDPELEGRVMLNWRILPDGKVQKVLVESTTVGDPEVAQCVARQVERWVFPPTAGGICQVRYPFVFTNPGLGDTSARQRR